MDDLATRLQTSLGDAYAIERELGGGGMARIFVAAERRFGRRVVVKVLAPELAASVSAERFEREVKLAAQLQQANIVPVFDAGGAGDLPFYTMPWVEGESLRERLTRVGALPIGEATAILSDVAKALAYAHARGIVHRDIKPENILLSGGTAVVTDFGIAKAIAASRTLAPFETLTQVGTSLGTPAYMAPEQAMGDPATDHRADLYALGVTAYEMLTGTRPFTATSPAALVRAHMTEIPRPIAERRPNVPPALAAVVMRCLGKEPADRPSSAEEVLRAIEGADVESRPVPQPVAAARPQSSAAGRHRLVAVVGGVILVATVVAAAIARRDRPDPPAPVVRDPGIVFVAAIRIGGDSSFRPLASIVGDAASRAFLQIPGLRLLEETAPPEQSAAGVTDAAMAERARNAGAGTVVSTSVLPVGTDSARVQFRVLDAATATVIRVLPPVKIPRNPADAEWGPLLDPLLATVGIVTTPALGAATLPFELPRFAAVRAVMAAFAAGSLTDSVSTATMLEHLARAAALDTGYVQPRLWGASTLASFSPSVSFAPRRRVIDSIRALYATQRDRLTPFENALFDYTIATDQGDAGGMLAALRRMRDVAPTTRLVRGMPRVLLDLNRPREALALMERSRPMFDANHQLISPDAMPMRWGTIADIRHYLHDYAGELVAARRAQSLEPGNIAHMRAVLRASAGLGDTAAIERDLASAAALPSRPNSYDFYGDFALQVGQELRAHGHDAYGKTLVRRAVAWFAAQPREQMPWRVRFRWALAHHDLGEEDHATAVLAPLLAQDSLPLYVGLAGRIAAARGDTATAMRIDARLAALGSTLQGTNTLERAFIASMLGKRDQAVSLLQQSFAEGQGFGIRWRLHWFPDTRPLWKYPPFERLLEPEG